jgi:hypothetical protein
MDGWPHENTPVLLLHAKRRPAAVVWGVVTVRIDAIDGMAGRALAHVGQEVLKCV